MLSGMPDLLGHLRLTADGTRLRERLATVGRELATGLREDRRAAAGGDPGRLEALATALARARAGEEAAALAGGRAAATQAALGLLGGIAEESGVPLLAAAERGDIVGARLIAGRTRQAFDAAVGALNTGFGGRSLFAGAAAGGPALRDGDAILADVAAAIAGAPDAATALAAIDFYFDDPAGGFATTAFTGSAQDAPAAELGEGGRVAFAERADSAAARGLLKGLAKAVTGLESPLGASDPAAAAFFAAAGTDLVAAQDLVTAARAGLGAKEAAIAAAGTRRAAERAAWELAESRMLARDPFEAAAEFQALEAQLQSAYTVTARIAGLSLASVLR